MPELTGATMISFRAGDLVEELRKRGSSSQVGAICRRDLRRYYWLLAVSLASAGRIPKAARLALRVRVAAARAAPTARGDLTSAVFAVAEVLPNWSPLQLLALADQLEREGEDGALIGAGPTEEGPK